MEILASLFHEMYTRICQLIYADITETFRCPFIDNLEDTEEFQQFQTDDVEFSKAIFALNSMPEDVFWILFNDHTEIAQTHMHIYLTKNNGHYRCTHHTLESLDVEIDNPTVRYIYIRVNLVNANRKYGLDHVNCLIIDKERKYVLVFEPKSALQYSVMGIKRLLGPSVESYDFLTPNDIGFKYLNRLQKFDSFCQTYVMFTFYLIIQNSDVAPEDYHIMLNRCITDKSVGQFLFVLWNLCKTSGMDINTVPVIWPYPGSGRKVIRIKQDLKEYVTTQEEHDDFVVVDAV